MNRLRPVDRLWLTAGVVIAVVLLAIGWFLFIGPQLTKAHSLRDQASETQQQVTVLRRRLVELRQQNEDLPRYQAQLLADQQALPGTAASSDFLRVLQTLGDRTGA